jgi:hypothetical protein
MNNWVDCVCPSFYVFYFDKFRLNFSFGSVIKGMGKNLFQMTPSLRESIIHLIFFLRTYDSVMKIESLLLEALLTD